MIGLEPTNPSHLYTSGILDPMKPFLSSRNNSNIHTYSDEHPLRDYESKGLRILLLWVRSSYPLVQIKYGVPTLLSGKGSLGTTS